MGYLVSMLALPSMQRRIVRTIRRIDEFGTSLSLSVGSCIIQSSSGPALSVKLRSREIYT